jgi:hypothetical protein
MYLTQVPNQTVVLQYWTNVCGKGFAHYVQSARHKTAQESTGTLTILRHYVVNVNMIRQFVTNSDSKIDACAIISYRNATDVIKTRDLVCFEAIERTEYSLILIDSCHLSAHKYINILTIVEVKWIADGDQILSKALHHQQKAAK